MSLYSSDTRYNTNNPIYAPLPINVSSITTSSLTANKIIANSTISGFFEGTYGEISNWYVDNTLYVNFQALTADSDQLFLNGIPVATTANLSSIQDWSIYAQISTLDGNNQSTIGLSYLETSTIGTRNLTASNIFTQNLMAFNIVNFTSTVIEVYESTIQSDMKLANISTANINNLYVSSGNFSTLNSINISAGTTTVNTITGTSASFSNFTASSITVSSIISPPVTAGSFSSITVVSNTNTGSLTVGNNNTTSFASAPTFSDGAQFNGTRPNFNTGINSSGANNFNNCNLDNVGRITANTVFVGSPNYVNIQTSSFTAILNNRGADVGGNSVIDLKSQFGAATRVNITADASSALAPTPTQIVSITANGATSLTQNAVGGRVSIVANAGSGSGTNILGWGQIDLTAYSSAPYPGVIKESAGSILAYSGLTVPTVGVPGGSFYSALTTLSLTCGATPATTSFPGVVYLRGDNGTKVANGLTTDTLTATGNSVLNTITTNGLTAFTGSSLAFFATSQNIQFNSATVGFNAVVAGPLSVSSITNVSTINGSPYVPGGGGGTVSTFTNLATSSFTVSSINGLPYSPGGGGWVSTATTRLNMNGNPITDLTGTLLLTVGSTNYTSFNQTSTSIDLLQAGGAGYVRRNVAGNILDTAGGNIQTQATSTINTVPHTIFTGDIKSAGATLTSNLTMGLNDIIFTGGKSLSCESNQIYMAGNGTDYVSMYNGGASVQIANDQNIYLSGNASSIGGINTVNYQNTDIVMNNGDINLNTNNISNVSTISAPNGNQVRLQNYSGSAWLDMYDAGNIYMVANSGQTNGGMSNGLVFWAGTNIQSQVYGNSSAHTFQVFDGSAVLQNSVIINNTTLTTSSLTVSSITSVGELSITANTDIKTSATSTINTVAETYFTGGITRFLISTPIPQPIIQYGQVSSSGSSGAITVTIPQRYTSVNSYLPFACMADTPAAEIYVSTLTRATFEIGWQNGGGGNQLFNWHTMGQ